LLFAGVLLPDVVDAFLGGAGPAHSVVTAVLLLVVVMLTTIGRRTLRRRLLALPIGVFLHLVLDGAFANTRIFWWPLSGVGLPRDRLPSLERGGWDVVLELAGAAILVWAYRRFGLRDPARRRLLLRTGHLDRSLV
jgi:hypothetical protein